MVPNALEVNNISKKYNGKCVINALSFELQFTGGKWLRKNDYIAMYSRVRNDTIWIYLYRRITCNQFQQLRST
jgi:hypothetical protein